MSQTKDKSDNLLDENKNEEEQEENLEQQNTSNIEEKLKDEQDDFEGYSKAAKYQLFILFFFLGIINHLGTILVMTGGRLLAYELEMKDYVTIYTSVSTIFSVLTRIINSKLCLKVSYKKRVVIICFWMMAGYLSMFAVLTLHETILEEYNVLCFILSFIPCFFLGSSYAFGESAMIAYLRLFPKTLIAGWSSGTGLSGLISGGLNFLSQLINGLSLKFLYLILTPVGLLYLILFTWTYRILKKQERKIERIKRYSMGNLSTSGRKTGLEDMKNKIDKEKEKEEQENEDKNEEDEEKGTENTKREKEEGEAQQVDVDTSNVNFEEEEKDAKSIKEEEDKEMEDMNKANQVMSFKNFSIVMHMCGQVIINLGLIYFLQFFCVNTLIVRVCSKVDITFLPLGTSEKGHYYRKGKFEFINLAYQVGMFTSKTLIKLVRKIQPIEIYTFSIALMNVIYIIEYYTGFLHWIFFLPIGLILGFFSGGTYAGGFYTILNSERVQKNYKELTVNVATLFNDSGTFLSGIVGFFALNYLFYSDTPFEGQEIVVK